MLVAGSAVNAKFTAPVVPPFIAPTRGLRNICVVPVANFAARILSFACVELDRNNDSLTSLVMVTLVYFTARSDPIRSPVLYVLPAVVFVRVNVVFAMCAIWQFLLFLHDHRWCLKLAQFRWRWHTLIFQERCLFSR